MFSRSFFRFQQQVSPTAAAGTTTTPEAPCGIPAAQAADTTGNSARIGGMGRRMQASVGHVIKYAEKHPYRFTAYTLLFFGSIFFYEANVTHGGRVKSFSHEHEYNLDISKEGQTARKIKAEKVLSAKEKTVLEERAKLQQQVEEAKARGETIDPRLEAEFQKHRNPGGTLLVTRGHLAEKENSWNVRNHERNWSILAQDHFKQKDSYVYRLERSKDDDFGRHAGKAQ
jgi:hypothetical protein